MDETSDDQTQPSSPATDAAPQSTDVDLVADDDLLIEEVSIDGMCGVY